MRCIWSFFLVLPAINCTPLNKGVLGPTALTPQAGTYPWLVKLEIKREEICEHHCDDLRGEFVNTRYSYCTGSLISENWIVTAAHCVVHANTWNSKVALLEVKVMYSDFRNDNETVLNVNGNVVHHKDYDPETITDDIALIKVKNEISVQPVRIIRTNQMARTDYKIAGYGRSGVWTPRGSYIHHSDQLLEGDVQLMADKQKCMSPTTKLYPQHTAHSYKLTHVLCAVDPNQVQDVCNGDSGGPLFIEENGQAFLHGITSTVIRGCNPKYGAMYTDVTKYMNWIESHIDVVEMETEGSGIETEGSGIGTYEETTSSLAMTTKISTSTIAKTTKAERVEDFDLDSTTETASSASTFLYSHVIGISIILFILLFLHN